METGRMAVAVLCVGSALAAGGCRRKETPVPLPMSQQLSCTMWLPSPWMLRVPPGGDRVLLAQRPHADPTRVGETMEVVGVVRPERAFDDVVAAVKAEAEEACRRGEGARIASEIDRNGLLLEYWWGDGPSGCSPEAHCPVPGLMRHLRFVSQQGDRVVLLTADLSFSEDQVTLGEVFRTFRCAVADGG